MGLIEAKGLARRIECPRELEHSRLSDAYDQSDVFVSSSLYEGYGMALAEAMMRGLPIVMAKGGAAAETVPEAAALKVPPGDVRALRVITEDASLRRRIADASWHAGRALPSWRDTAEACARAIREAALYAGRER
jgi:glycosyltransferase involved in cell wall biosynthesis